MCGDVGKVAERGLFDLLFLGGTDRKEGMSGAQGD